TEEELAVLEIAVADVVVLSGAPDAADVAAVTAVLSGVLEELAEEQGRRRLAGASAWERSQRSLRAPLVAGPGQWRGFSG
ncbi:MAG: hypothetical protein JWR36_797, partial [Glaciihabitans sp.]|nr:hypothetical protein [Glaciihabitans sp.]